MHTIPVKPTRRQIKALLEPFGDSLPALRRSNLRVAIRLFSDKKIPAVVFNPPVITVTLMPELLVFDYSNTPLVVRLADISRAPDCPELKKFRLGKGVEIRIKQIFRTRHGIWSAHFRFGDKPKDGGDFNQSLHVTIIPGT